MFGGISLRENKIMVPNYVCSVGAPIQKSGRAEGAATFLSAQPFCRESLPESFTIICVSRKVCGPSLCKESPQDPVKREAGRLRTGDSQ